VVIVGLVAVFAARAGDDEVVPAIEPDPTTSPTLAPATTVPFANPDTTFVSPRNGFSVRYSERVEGTISEATQLWGFSERPDDAFDVVETGPAVVFKGTSTELPDDVPIDDWIDESVSDESFMWPDSCHVPRREQAEITIDGQSGRLAECANRIEATVVAGRRLYYFVLLHDRGDARAVFDTFAATIDLTPQTAVDVPTLASTFVSPTNGFSFDFLDRGGLAPATQPWHPDSQPFIPVAPQLSDAHDDRFDVVETALGAVFKAASTPIPDGVPIDQWVDEHVSAGGCDTPRNQQDEITIDGQAGSLSTCPDRIEATVVAGGRLYYFVLISNRSDANAIFDAWVETMDLTPETAAVP
jgi:hypothetical protein